MVGQPQPSAEGTAAAGSSAWSRLPEFATDIADGISDSESIASIGELGDDARLSADREGGEVPDENLNNWEVRVTQQVFVCRDTALIVSLFFIIGYSI